MEIRLKNINRENLEKRKELIEKLLEEDFSNMEFSQENLAKAKELAKKYKEATSDDWNTRPIEIIIANSEGTELATIR